MTPQKIQKRRTLRIILMTVGGSFLLLFIIIGIFASHDPAIQAQVRHDDSVAHISDSLEKVKTDSLKLAQKVIDDSINHEKQLNEKAERMVDQLPEAWELAKDAISDKLKAPASAKFPEYNIHFMKPFMGNSVLITSYVDAQNSFGALLRTKFVCVAKYNDKDEWELVSAQLDE